MLLISYIKIKGEKRIITHFLFSGCESAFQRCSSLKEVNIPSFVISTGNSAFSKCSSLSKLSIHSKFLLDKIGIDSNLTILYLKYHFSINAVSWS